MDKTKIFRAIGTALPAVLIMWYFADEFKVIRSQLSEIDRTLRKERVNAESTGEKASSRSEKKES